MKKVIISILILALIIFVAAFIFRPQTPLPQPILIDTQNQPSLGQKNAKVEIVAFEDLKCVACKEFTNTIFPQLKKEYIDTGIAKFTFINLAFIPGSIAAANAAHCIYKQNPELFFPFVDYVYANQPPENENWATIPKLLEFASRIKGINQDQLSQCVFNNTYTSIIDKNLQLAQKAIGPTIMTPTLFINGIRVDPLTINQIKKIINHVR